MSHRQTGLTLLALVFVTFAVYAEVWNHEFLLYDDDKYVTGNEFLQQGINAHTIAWAFTTSHASLWLPLCWISHMVDFQLFGMHAGWHHYSNLVLHLLNTALLFLALVRLTGNRRPSLIVAALFALHPLHVESVAWVTERKDTLSAFFFFLTILAWVRYVQKPTVWRYLATLIAMAASLMSKPMLVTLPFVLLLLDYWPLARLGGRSGLTRRTSVRRLLIEKIPLFAMSIAVSIITMVVASRGGIVADPTQVPLAARLGNVVVSYAMYLVKFVWPFRLSALYPFRGGESALSVSLAGLALILLTTLALRRSRTRPWLIVGWLWYLGMLVPVVGFVQQGSHAMADRYTYLSLIGIFVAVTWSLSAFAERSAVRRRATTFITVVVLLGLAGTTYRQVGFWRDTETLFEHAIACDPENFRAYTHAGVAYAASGDTQKAVEYYRVALQLDFTAYSAHNNLARLLAQEGRTEEALRHYELARHGHPDNPVINYNMGNLYARVGMAEEAIASYRRALEFRPEYHDATTNLALTLAASGDFKESESLLRGLLESRRHDPVVRYNLACVLSLRGDSGRALDWLREAVRLGFSDWEILDTDSDLENLQSTAAFQDWVRAR